MIRIPYMCLNLQTIRFLNKLLKQHILFSTYFLYLLERCLALLKFENASERRLCLKTRARKPLTNLRHWSRLAKNIYSCIQLYAYYTVIDCV